MSTSRLHALILAGGSGTRLWPWSRRSRPKQLLPLVGETSMLVQTVDRLAGCVPPERVWILTNAEYVDAVRAQLPDVPADQVIGEPRALGNAAAVGMGAALVRARDPEATMAVLTADHVITPVARFQAALARAAQAAAAGNLVTFGIPPTHPSTGFGYVELGDPLGDDALGAKNPAHTSDEPDPTAPRIVARFVEKPDAATARDYLASGRFLWNSGMFVWTVPTILEAYRSLLPGTAAVLDEMTSLAKESADAFAAGLPALWEQIPDRTTVDYGILEPSDNVACVPADFSWSDIGSWEALTEARIESADEAGNVLLTTGEGDTRGRHVDAESRDCMVFSGGGRMVATVGLDGLVVVDTGDVVLVMPRDRAQDIKLIVNKLQDEGPEGLL